MRPGKLSLNAAGNSPWFAANYLQNTFGIGLGAILTSGATLTYSVQHTFDDIGPDSLTPVTVNRAGTVMTVTDPGHRVTAGDSVIIQGSGSSQMDSQFLPNLPSTPTPGQQIPWDVASVVDANNYTVTVVNAGPTAGLPFAVASRQRVFPHASLVAQTVRADGNYQFNIRAVRLKVTSYTSGGIDLCIIQGIGR